MHLYYHAHRADSNYEGPILYLSIGKTIRGPFITQFHEVRT